MLTMLGIPNCNTIKKARTYLESHDVDFKFRDLRKEPLDRSEWDALVAADNSGALLNTRSPTFRKTGVSKDELTPEKTAALLEAHPSAMKRPTMVEGSQIRSIGFSEEMFEQYVAGA